MDFFEVENEYIDEIRDMVRDDIRNVAERSCIRERGIRLIKDTTELVCG